MDYIKRKVECVTKSCEDTRVYRGLELENELKVLLISDSNTPTSAAALVVNVGSMSDPVELPGLSHLCAHALLLSSGLNWFVSRHGGVCNGNTITDQTNYHFYSPPQHFIGALEKFAGVFRTPPFTESEIQQAINVVNSEYERNISDDSWSFEQLERSISKQNHGFNTFGTGNKLTLDDIPKLKGINVGEELLKFVETWYSSNIMTLCILGKESLNDLETVVVDLFACVKNNHVTSPHWLEHPFGSTELKTKCFAVPVMDVSTLTLSFPIPDVREHYRAQPACYLQYVFAHEGPGSVSATLKSLDWGASVDAAARPVSRGFSFFEITVHLSEEGVNNVDNVVQMVFQYVYMLKREGPQEWIVNELRDIRNMQFRFQDKIAPASYVGSISANIHHVRLEDALCGNYLIAEWRPDLIDMLMTYLTPENVRLTIISPKFESRTDKVEQWYGTKYKLERISEATINEWKKDIIIDDLKLPSHNEFITTDFNLMPPDVNAPAYPILIQDTPLTRVWFKQDGEFHVPRAELSFELSSCVASLDPDSCAMTHMLVALLQDALAGVSAAAARAGIHSSLLRTARGLLLRISGFSGKQHMLLDRVLKTLVHLKIDPTRYQILKENYVRELNNFQTLQPLEHAVTCLAALLADNSWTNEELLASARGMRLAALETFIPHLLSKLRVECLVHGNIDKQRALQLVHVLQKHLNDGFNSSGHLLRKRELQLQSGCNYLFEVYNTVHRNSCALVYYQCQSASIRTSLVLALLLKMMSDPCIENLRTMGQLGHIVSCDTRVCNGGQGLRIVAQSDRHPKYEDQRVEAFIASVKDYICSMSEENFEEHKECLTAQYLVKPRTLSNLTARFWSEIMSREYNFDRANIEISQLRTVQKQDVIQLCEDMLEPSSPLRSKLAVHVVSVREHVVGDAKPLPPGCREPVTIRNIAQFKNKQSVFPLLHRIL